MENQRYIHKLWYTHNGWQYKLEVNINTLLCWTSHRKRRRLVVAVAVAVLFALFFYVAAAFRTQNKAIDGMLLGDIDNVFPILFLENYIVCVKIAEIAPTYTHSRTEHICCEAVSVSNM